MKIKTKKINKNWIYFKIVMINWIIFTLIVVFYAGFRLVQTLKEKDRQLDTCQTNIEAISEQIDSGSIILKLKTK